MNVCLPLLMLCVLFSLPRVNDASLQMIGKMTLFNLPFELRQSIWEEVIGHYKDFHIRLLHHVEDRSLQRLRNGACARDRPET